MSESLQSEFLKWPAELQRQKLQESRALTQYAFDHVVPIVISPPPSSVEPAALRSASGFLLALGDRTFLGTAHHVWKGYLDRVQLGEHVIFQAGPIAIDATTRSIRTDPDRDIAFIEISQADAARFQSAIAKPLLGWPPPLPVVGSFVALSGCPEARRDHDTPSHIGFALFSSVLRIASSEEHFIVCDFDRDKWIWDGPIPPPGPDDELSGMSGGPVFALFEGALRLVGLISLFSYQSEWLVIRTFDGFTLLP
jgi:Trypsin-like peptidase domain